MTNEMVPSILAKIIDQKKKEISNKAQSFQPNTQQNEHWFKKSITRKTGEAIKIIAECKKGSPSEGIINNNYNPLQIANVYQQNGVNAISVLTDAQFFFGSLEDLDVVSKNINLPVLCKDFFIDEIQIHEARNFGASAILLIASILNVAQIQKFIKISSNYKMDAIVEIHNESDMDIALEANAEIIGINNRDLHDFSTDLYTTIKLSRLIKKHSTGEAIIISESAIKNKQDVDYINDYADVILVGTALMRGNTSELLNSFSSK